MIFKKCAVPTIYNERELLTKNVSNPKNIQGQLTFFTGVPYEPKSQIKSEPSLPNGN